MRSTRIWFVFFSLACLIQSNAIWGQSVFTRSSNANWNSDIWANTSGGAVVPGLRPSPTVSAVIQNNNVIVNSPVTTNNLTVNSGRFISHNSSSITISGDLTLNGSGAINATTSSTIVFSGANKIITAGIVVFNNLTLSANATISLADDTYAELNGLMSFGASSSFDANAANFGQFVVRSTTLTNGGRIGDLTGATFVGPITIERFIDGTGGTGEWRYLSMPVIDDNGVGGSANLGQWSTNFPVTGSFSDASPAIGNVAVSTAPSIYTFDNPLGTADYVAVSGSSTGSTPIDNTRGYVAYTYISSNFTIAVSGNPAIGNVSIPLGTNSYSVDSRKWNLVPNPYPSPIAWNSITTTGLLNANPTIYLPKTDGSVSTYVKNSGSGTNSPFVGWLGEVAIGQAFWVENNSATQLSLTEAVKTTDRADYSRIETPENIFSATLKSLSKNQKDELIIYFKETATTSVDGEFDGRKRPNGDYVSDLGINSYINFSSYSKEDPTKLAISAIPYLTCQSTVKLAVTDVPVGSYSISFSQLETFTKQFEIKLIDHFLNDKETIAANGVEYSFAVTSNPASFGLNRFEITFSLPRPTITSSGNLLVSSSKNNNQWFKDGSAIPGATDATYQVTETGVYSVGIVSQGCTLKSENITLAITALADEVITSVEVFPNPVKGMLTVKLPNEIERELRIISVSDIRGGIIYSTPYSPSGKNSVEVDLSGNGSGLYLLRLMTDKKSFLYKIIKE